MKFTINTILYLLCASVITGQCVNAADHVVGMQQEANINLAEYVDLELVYRGHEDAIKTILLNHPEQAARLRKLYQYCNSYDVKQKQLFESASELDGSRYLVAHRASAPVAFARKQIDEYDQLIEDLGLGEHMDAFELDFYD